jgi:hypothetical protein
MRRRLARKLFQGIPHFSKPFPSFFQAFSKDFQTFSLAVLKEINGLPSNQPEFALMGIPFIPPALEWRWNSWD